MIGSPKFFPKQFSSTRNDHEVRDFPKRRIAFSSDSCIQATPHAADPESNLVSASPVSHIHSAQRLVGIHSRNV